MRRLAGGVLLAVVLAVSPACSEGDPGADGDVESLGDLVPSPVADELTRSGGCIDGRLWAADESGSLAVIVEALGMTSDRDEVELPSDDVDVTVLHGDGLTGDLCADDLAPDTSSPAAQGQVGLERDELGCVAEFRIDGLEAEDGTTFGPIEGDATATACTPG
ncbi:MAG TPA: hypothetical protein VK507_16845 [Iamia sp.]|nr:hypothetical protein [Iamia sp.]